MRLILSSYEPKIDCYNFKMFCISLIVTTKQTPIVDIQKIKRKESKHTTGEIHQVTKEDNKIGRK